MSVRHKNGHGTNCDAAKCDALLAEMSKGVTIRKACQAVGIRPDQAYGWRIKYEAFEREFLRIREIWRQFRVDEIEERLFAEAADGNVQAMTLVLRAHRPEKYAERHVLDVLAEPVVKVYGGVDLEKV